MGKRLAGALIGIVAILGMRFYAKTSAHDNVKARLVALCESDEECLADVKKHFDGCFEASYKGERSSRLDLDALVKCVNDRSGVPYFLVSSPPSP